MGKRCELVILISLMIFFIMASGAAEASRIKDLVTIKGIRTNQLIGYGIVVGLNGTGDKSGTRFTVQSLANLMSHMGVHVSKSQLKVKNVAAVMVTAKLEPFARIGSRLDVVVSSVGDAKSLSGGTLLLTPLMGVDGKVYALAQGPLALGGVGAAGAGGGGVTKNHLQVARLSGGATVEKEIPVQLDGKKQLVLALDNPDFTTATRIADAIDRHAGTRMTKVVDSGTLLLWVPKKMRKKVARLIAGIEYLDVTPDTLARIVVNEKTGTVVIGEKVRISTVAVSHGNLSVTIKEGQDVSQPEPLSTGKTVTAKSTKVKVEEEKSKVILLPHGTTIGELVKALNAIGVTPRDMISIFQTIKAAGALQAELVII